MSSKKQKLPGWIEQEAERTWRRAIDAMNERRASEGREPIEEDSKGVRAQRHAHLHGFLAGFRFGARHGG